jgi:hypothetical protein
MKANGYLALRTVLALGIIFLLSVWVAAQYDPHL